MNNVSARLDLNTRMMIGLSYEFDKVGAVCVNAPVRICEGGD